MNKNLIISLLAIALIVAFAFIITKDKSATLDQEAASLRASQTPAYQNVQNTPVNSNARGQFQALACVVTIRNNPPVLPSPLMPQLPFSSQNTIFNFETESVGCSPGDAYFQTFTLAFSAAAPTNPWSLRPTNFTITNTTTGLSNPAVNFTVISAGDFRADFKVGADLSVNGIQSFEVKADFDIDQTAMGPFNPFVSAASNFQLVSSAGLPVIPSLGIVAQIISY